MIKKFTRLSFLFILLFAGMGIASATGCVNTHVDGHHDDYGDSSRITPRILKGWENWCGRGFTAQKLDAAIQPCLMDKVDGYRDAMGQDAGIKFDILEEFRDECRAALQFRFQQTKQNSAVDTFNLLATIDDPDGYTNVRSQKNAKSQVVTRVVSGEQFFTFRQDGNWWQIRTRSGKVGYMHISRIRLID